MNPNLDRCSVRSIETTRLETMKIGGVAIAPIVEQLQDLGFSYEIQGTLRGMSGEEHRFDIVARRGNMIVAVNILVADRDEPDERALIGLRARLYDCAPDLGVVIYTSDASDRLKNLCKFYRMAVIEGTEARKISGDLAKSIQSVL